ncbi:hypothetical protein, partial [Umezakia ovalisporum]
YRIMPQNNEVESAQALISIKPDYFWALMDSLIDDGYLPTENILVLKTNNQNVEMTVKEGNRRIAALKIILGYIILPSNIVPSHIENKINSLSQQWRDNNNNVPCSIFEAAESNLVDKIVTLAHGKGEKAGRFQWSAVARARHNRDASKNKETALDLLEKFLVNTKNITINQKERWSGDYPLSVLDEAIKRSATRFGASNSPDLAKKYPSIQYVNELNELIKDIGLEEVRFETIREKDKDFLSKYNIPSVSQPSSSNSPSNQTTPSGTSTSGSTSTSTSTSTTKGTAHALNDPKSVTNLLRNFRPVGSNRDKIETLRKEMLKLKISDTPLSFCFLLRSMFEISAKAYCQDHSSSGLSATKSSGEDKKLIDVLREITRHITNNNSDKAKLKELHGSLTELGKPDGILSVTSLNQLIHHPTFSLSPSDISTIFNNVFPLLKQMNS